MEYKSTPFEVKDINKGERTAVIAFASYDNIDRTKDILRKGAFTKSWAENKSDIRLFLNHDPNQAPGKPLDFFEDDSHAYVKAYMGTHTLGEDTLKMMDEGIITDSSFGFNTIKSSNIEVKGQKIRELKEVKQFEASILTHWGANPLSKVQMVTKANDPMIEELRDRLEVFEKFVRNTTASDDTIKMVIGHIFEIKSILSKVDTANTLDGEPDASENEGEKKDNEQALAMLTLLNSKFSF